MVSVVNRLKNNIRILWLGLILVIWLVITRLNTQTASLTDVFPSVDDQTMSKADVAYIIDEKWSYLSTLKQYDVWTGATLRISFLVPTEEQQQLDVYKRQVSCMLPTLTGTATPWSTVVATLSWYSFTWTADGSGNYAIPLSWNFADGNYTVDTTVIVTGSALDSYTTGTFSTVNSIFATWLSLPIWITFNAYNNIYIGNYGNDTVVTMSWWMLIPYANWFNHTVDIVFDIRWNLYVSNDLSHTISKVNIWWTVSTFAWWFTWPHWLLYDSLWRMYVTNRNWNTISQLTTWWIWSTFINGLNKPCLLYTSRCV